MRVPSHRGRAALAILGLVAFATLSSRATAQDPPVERPRLHFLRQDEDYSDYARGLPTDADIFDEIHHLALSEDGDVWVGFGGSARLRYEIWDGFNFGAPAGAQDSDTFLLSRLLLHGDLHLGERYRVFVEGKSAQSSDRALVGGRRTIDVDTLDLQQLFVDAVVPIGEESTLRLRPGRQMLKFGRQRLVSPLPWGNTLRTWDGISARVEHRSWDATGFWSRFVPVEKYDSNSPDDDRPFGGVYATHTLDGPQSGFDVYWLYLGIPNASRNGTVGDEDRHTVGARGWRPLPCGSLTLEGEVAYQFGDVDGHALDAAMASFELSRPILEGRGRGWIGLDYASGDHSPGGSVQTFDPLFPLGHAYFGAIDAIGRQNLVAAMLGVSSSPGPRVTLSATAHAFWRADTSDAVYNAGGGVARVAGGSGEREIGQEIDLSVVIRVHRRLTTHIGYGHFFPGEFIRETGPEAPTDFVYVSLESSF